MSTWLAKALAARAQPAHDRSDMCANSANSAKTPADGMLEGGFGTNGTIGTASEVPADEIRACFAWAVRRLVEEHGLDQGRARRDAFAILKVELLNDPRLAPIQVDTHRCFVCGGIDTPAHVLVPVLTARPDARLWLHLEPCHYEHQRRRSGEVDELLRRALSRPTISANVEEDPSREGGHRNSASSREGPAVTVAHATPQNSKLILDQPHEQP
jgi:hypothetical protein